MSLDVRDMRVLDTIANMGEDDDLCRLLADFHIQTTTYNPKYIPTYLYKHKLFNYYTKARQHYLEEQNGRTNKEL